MMNEALSTIMTRNVVTLSPTDKLSKAKNLIFEKHYHHIPVVNEDGTIEGIVTSYDLMKLNLKFEEYDSMLIEQVMTRKIVTLQPEEKIGAAARIFLRHLFHGLPIVDENRHLQGIVTTHDVMRFVFDKSYPNDELEKAYRLTDLVHA